MKKTRRKIDAALKAKIALEALREQATPRHDPGSSRHGELRRGLRFARDRRVDLHDRAAVSLPVNRGHRRRPWIGTATAGRASIPFANISENGHTRMCQVVILSHAKCQYPGVCDHFLFSGRTRPGPH